MILVMGMLAALTILSGQVYNTQVNTPVELSQEESSDDAEDQQPTIIKSVDAAATTANLSLTHQFYFINEILHTEKDHTESTYLELPKLSTFFATLFRQIISPNAP